VSFRDSVARFVRERINPHAAEWNEAGTLPREIWHELGSLGFLGVGFDPVYGGSGADFLYSVILAEELGRSRCSGLGAAVGTHTDMSSNYLLEGSAQVREKHLPKCIRGDAVCCIAMTEPSGGSDLAALRTSAIRRGDSYVVNGQKTFITNGCAADLAVVAVRTAPASARSHEGISLLLVETSSPGFRRGLPLKKMGNTASDTAELFFEDLHVPVGHLIGEENGGFKILMANLGRERLIGAAGCLAACEEMLRETIAYTKNRKVFGKPVSTFQANNHKLVELYTEAALARAFFYECCRRYMQGQPIVKEISMIKYFAAELANKIAYCGVSLHGGWGYMKEYPICQWYTDVRLYNIGGGTTEVMKDVVARQLELTN